MFTALVMSKFLPAVLPPFLVLDPLLQGWLLEDIGRGDRTTQAIFPLGDQTHIGCAQWVAKQAGVVAGMPLAARLFNHLNDKVVFTSNVNEGQWCDSGQAIAELSGPVDALLMGERVALNLVMRLSGIATLTREFVDLINDLPTHFVDTRKTTPGLRLLEKYAAQVGGAMNHRMGLDDAVMIKDNHIAAAGGIQQAISKIRACIPYPLTIEVETENLKMVGEALECNADIIMLDNMSLPLMAQAVQLIRSKSERCKVEASGNITLKNIREVAETGVDYISSSAPVTRSHWLDISMRLQLNSFSA